MTLVYLALIGLSTIALDRLALPQHLLAIHLWLHTIGLNSDRRLAHVVSLLGDLLAVLLRNAHHRGCWHTWHLLGWNRLLRDLLLLQLFIQIDLEQNFRPIGMGICLLGRLKSAGQCPLTRRVQKTPLIFCQLACGRVAHIGLILANSSAGLTSHNAIRRSGWEAKIV